MITASLKKETPLFQMELAAPEIVPELLQADTLMSQYKRNATGYKKTRLTKQSYHPYQNEHFDVNVDQAQTLKQEKEKLLADL